MQDFKSYTQPAKKFVGLFFDYPSTSALREWAQSNGFDLSKSFDGNDIDPNEFDFHTTIFFTTSEHSTPVGEFFIEPVKLTVSSMGILGAERQIPVLHVDLSTKLENLRYSYERDGFKDAWPDYKPHISVSYNWTGTPPIASVKVPDFEISANRIVVQNQTAS